MHGNRHSFVHGHRFMLGLSFSDSLGVRRRAMVVIIVIIVTSTTVFDDDGSGVTSRKPGVVPVFRPARTVR